MEVSNLWWLVTCSLWLRSNLYASRHKFSPVFLQVVCGSQPVAFKCFFFATCMQLQVNLRVCQLKSLCKFIHCISKLAKVPLPLSFLLFSPSRFHVPCALSERKWLLWLLRRLCDYLWLCLTNLIISGTNNQILKLRFMQKYDSMVQGGKENINVDRGCI